MTTASVNLPTLPLYQQIANAIEHQVEVGRFAANEKIYSIREMCEQFGVGDVTAKRAVKRLTDRGVVHTVAGSGIYVSSPREEGDQPTRRANSAGLIMIDTHPRTIFQYEMDLIQQELQRAGHPMVYMCVDGPEELPAAIKHMGTADVGCLIVFPPHGPSHGESREQIIEHLPRSSYPMLVLETVNDLHGYVAANIENSSALLADHFYELGHRNLCLVSAFKPKVAGFKRAIDRLNDPTLHLDHIPGSIDSQHRMGKLARQMLDLSPRPTAVAVCNDRMAEVFIDACIEEGLDVPGEISIATYDDHPKLSQLASVAVTTVRHPSLEISQEVGRWAHDRLIGRRNPGKAFRRQITGSLIVRDSTGPGPTAGASDDR